MTQNETELLHEVAKKYEQLNRSSQKQVIWCVVISRICLLIVGALVLVLAARTGPTWNDWIVWSCAIVLLIMLTAEQGVARTARYLGGWTHGYFDSQRFLHPLPEKAEVAERSP